MAAILFRCSASEAMQRTTMYDRPFASWPRSTTQTCRRRATSIASAASLGQPRSSQLQRAGDSGGLWLQASSRRGTRRPPTFQHKPKLPLVNMTECAVTVCLTCSRFWSHWRTMPRGSKRSFFKICE
ncbi:unnamed protein product [Symbiodinium microadriaticum]|nr:unnamed protein product [Symbiodinium microadriaticum]